MNKDQAIMSEEEKIVEMYKSGKTIKNICRTLHRGGVFVRNVLKGNNITVCRGKNLPIDAIVEEYQNGSSTCKIAKKYGVDASTILRHLNLNGVDASRGLYKRTSPDMEEKIILDYQSGMSMSQVGEKYGVNAVTVKNILDRQGITPRTKGGLNQINWDEIVKLYKKGNSTGKIAKLYDISVKTVCDILKRYNVKRDNRQGGYNLDRDFWKNIDTPAKAYFLGWLITDGNVWGKQVRIELGSSDEEILELFRKYTGNTSKIHRRKRVVKAKDGSTIRISYFSCVTAYCKQWVVDLNKLGIHPNKTPDFCIPEISEELLPHMLRGMIDGDGSVSKSGNLIAFYGNQANVEKFRQLLFDRFEIKFPNLRVRESVSWISWGSKRDVKTIGEYIYNDKSDLFLKRKYDRWISNPNNQSILHANTEISVQN